MYRFTLSGNRGDHKPIVVAAVVFVLFSGLYLHTFIAKVIALISTSLVAFLVIQKIKSLQPYDGTILLEQQQLSFHRDGLNINGNISAKTFILGDTIYLCVQGLTKRYWLVLATSSIDEQSLARLKRAIFSVSRGCTVTK